VVTNEQAQIIRNEIDRASERIMSQMPGTKEVGMVLANAYVAEGVTMICALVAANGDERERATFDPDRDIYPILSRVTDGAVKHILSLLREELPK
jgi:hypothetical protein